jgi:hypothetical protein
MNKRSTRFHFVSEWLLEFSVLWAVFPLLDQLLSGRIETWILAASGGLAVLSFLIGLFVRPSEE